MSHSALLRGSPSYLARMPLRLFGAQRNSAAEDDQPQQVTPPQSSATEGPTDLASDTFQESHSLGEVMAMAYRPGDQVFSQQHIATFKLSRHSFV